MDRNRLLQNQVVIVTGAARGLGAAQARLCAPLGARVVVADIRDELAQAVVAHIGRRR